ncbi:hypothetical protein HDU76_007555, partial [Blyttiomyces sp. JEL0837]
MTPIPSLGNVIDFAVYDRDFEYIHLSEDLRTPECNDPRHYIAGSGYAGAEGTFNDHEHDPTPEAWPAFVRGRVHGLRQLELLLDTGSNVTLCSKAYFDKLQMYNNRKIPLHPATNVTSQGVSEFQP